VLKQKVEKEAVKEGSWLHSDSFISIDNLFTWQTDLCQDKSNKKIPAHDQIHLKSFSTNSGEDKNVWYRCYGREEEKDVEKGQICLGLTLECRNLK
jgi:hypothetical protein